MPRSKIIYGDEVLIDLTGDTVTADTLAEGATAHDKAGNAITGTMVAAKPEQAKTATPSTSQQVIKPDSGYALSQVTVNAMPTATQATPSISVSSGGLITASAQQAAGYVSAGTKSATKQLTTQAAKTVTPSLSQQTAVASGAYTTGAVTVAPITSALLTSLDSDFKADNIAEGVNMFGVVGTFAGGGAKIAAGIVSAGSDGIIAVSGLDFTPVHLYLIRKFQTNTTGRMNYMIDGIGYTCSTSTSQTERQCDVTLSSGSFSVAQTTGVKPSGDYYYIVWS